MNLADWQPLNDTMAGESWEELETAEGSLSWDWPMKKIGWGGSVDGKNRGVNCWVVYCCCCCCCRYCVDGGCCFFLRISNQVEVCTFVPIIDDDDQRKDRYRKKKWAVDSYKQKKKRIRVTFWKGFSNLKQLQILRQRGVALHHQHQLHESTSF